MLDHIVSGKEKSQTVLITDTVNQRGLGLLKCFTQGSINNVDQVIVVLLENSCRNFGSLLHSQRVEIYTPGVDPLGWLDTNTSKVTCNTISNDILSILKLHSEKKVLVIFDNLSHIITQISASYVCQMLYRISSVGKDIVSVSLLHRDLHDNNILDLIQHQSSSVLHLSPASNTAHHGLVQTLHKRTTGKVLRSKEYFNLSEQFELCDIQEATSILKPGVVEANNDGPDPTANLTFNLSLSDKEKDDRKKVPLPYMHQGESGGGGKIFYQPDEADDFDEEDPDDDLDI